MEERRELGQMLVERGIITQDQLLEVLAIKRASTKFLGEILVEKGYASREDVLGILTGQSRADFVRLSRYKGLSADIAKLIPENLARRYTVLAIAQEKTGLVVAMADPTDIVAIDAVSRVVRTKVRVVRAEEKEILGYIEKFYLNSGDISQTLADLEAVRTEERAEEPDLDVNELKVAAEDAPIIRFANSLFIQAVERRATDIHLEPLQDTVAVRLRIDGVLQHVSPPPKSAYQGVVTRLKVLANLDIGERRLPQDGRIRLKIGRKEIDIRMSTLPTVYGEKVVLRVLDKESFLIGMEELGLEGRHLQAYKTVLKNPYGMLLVTGPTGSGKTTTLYAGLNFINTPARNIITVEDPVEYEIRGINQVHVKPKIGLTFPAVLRTLLRQDPDVIMVGEIRDLETAQIAIQAALTGHLVLSTLHTNDTVSTISRLSYMGVESYLVAACLHLVISQRLVRRVCPSCRSEDPDGRGILEKMGNDTSGASIVRGKGCPECEHTGYRGRIAIYEILSLTQEVRKMIVDRESEDRLRELARSQGMTTLREAAMRTALSGITTVSEALGVTLL